MTSNNSIYKMIREHLRHNLWMLGLSAIGSLLFGPVMFLFAHGGENYERYRLNHTVEEFNRYVSNNVIEHLNYCSTALLVIATVGAAIVAFGIFSYLFNSRKIDLYHSLPVTRKEMFWSSYLTGLLIWAVPFLTGALISFSSAFIILEDFTLFTQVLMVMLRYLLSPTLGFFIVYHLCLIGVMLSGNIANAMVSTGVWGLSVLIIHLLLIVYAEAFFDNYYDPGNNYYITYALSPLAAPFTIASYGINEGFEYFAMILISLVLAGFNLFVAYKLYKVRKSELAGHGMDNKVASLSIRICIAIILGLLGVIPMYLFGYSMESRPMWILLFNALFAALSYAVVTALQKRSLKAFFAHKIQMLVVTAFSICIAVIYVFDIFGYDDYLPRKGSIESMEIDIGGFDGYYYYSGAFEGFEITDSEMIHNILENAVTYPAKSNTFSITVKISPKFGFDYYRRYRLDKADIDALRPVVETENYMAYRLRELLNSRQEINNIHVYAANSSTDIESLANVQKIIDAYIKDSNSLLSFETQGEYLVMANLSFRTYTKESDGGGNYYHIMEVPVTPAHVNTIQAIRDADERIICHKDQMEIQSVNLSFHAYNLTIEDALYKDLLPLDMLNFKDNYAEEYGIPVADSIKEQAVVIQTTSSYSSGEYSATFTGEELKGLMPYLYFADGYQDSFGFDNFTHVGYATIQYNQQVDVYMKRGDMSQEEIKKLADRLTPNTIYY